MTDLYTSFWSNRELGDVDAVIVSISRTAPRWRLAFAYRALPELAPYDRVWNTSDEEGYERAYLDQLEELGASRILAALERIGGGRPVILLCWERPDEEFCHRWVLGRFIEERTGIEVLELRTGILRKRPDAPQQALFDVYGEEDTT